MEHLKLLIRWMLILNVLSINCREVPPSGSITNGQKAGEKDFPYIVAIEADHMINGGKVTYFGAGAILGDKWIITSKGVAFQTKDRKIEGKKGLKVYPKYDNDPNSKLYETAPRFEVEKRFCPASESSNWQESKTDLTLLKLKHPIKFDEKIKPIQIIDRIDGLKRLRFAGWGMTDAKNRSSQFQSLRYANINLQGGSCDEKCKIKFDGPKEGYQAACYGDEGGPVVTKVKNSDAEALVGLIAGFDQNCDQYSLFVNVSKHKPWVSDVMQNEPNKYSCT